MIGTPLLLFPDTGDGFLRTLRTAALYSDSVNVLTLTDASFASILLDALGAPGDGESEIVRRLREYFRFVHSNSSDMDMLVHEGVLKSVITEDHASWWTLSESRDLASARLRELDAAVVDEAAWQLLCDRAGEAFDSEGSCLADLDTMAAICSFVEHPDADVDVRSGETQEKILHHMFLRYLMQVAAASELLGAPTLSWSPRFQQAMLAARRVFATSDGPTSTIDRGAAAAQIAHQILERHLPRVDELPMDELLALRSKRKDELDSLRIAIRQLATEVDVTAPPDSIALQVEDLVASRVDPAVDDVRRAVETSRLEIFKRLGRSAGSISGATFTVAVAVAAGAPLNTSAAIGALGGALGVMLEGELEKSRIRKASQWSLLYRLSNTQTQHGKGQSPP